MLQSRGAIAKEGDTVLVFRGHLSVTPLLLKRGEVLHCKEGRFAHDGIIGQPLGTYAKAIGTDVPSLLILQNSADLWTQAVPHRTQIIYDTDIAVIIFNLRLGPGSRVVEAGTGSGSLTHSLAKTVAPNGTVFTNDFHKGRCLEARKEFRSNGLGPQLVSSNWRDVCTTNVEADIVEGTDADVASMTEPQIGMGLPAQSVDAVFLDVPAPWAAIDNVRHVLRPGGMLCTFSPCIEQTQRTAAKLREAPYDFLDIRTVESLTKYFDPVYKRAREAGDHDSLKFRASLVSKGHSAYLTFARRRLSPLPEAVEEDDKEKEEEKKEEDAEAKN